MFWRRKKTPRSPVSHLPHVTGEAAPELLDLPLDGRAQEADRAGRQAAPPVVEQAEAAPPSPLSLSDADLAPQPEAEAEPEVGIDAPKSSEIAIEAVAAVEETHETLNGAAVIDDAPVQASPEDPAAARSDDTPDAPLTDEPALEIADPSDAVEPEPAELEPSTEDLAADEALHETEFELAPEAPVDAPVAVDGFTFPDEPSGDETAFDETAVDGPAQGDDEPAAVHPADGADHGASSDIGADDAPADMDEPSTEFAPDASDDLADVEAPSLTDGPDDEAALAAVAAEMDRVFADSEFGELSDESLGVSQDEDVRDEGLDAQAAGVFEDVEAAAPDAADEDESAEDEPFDDEAQEADASADLDVSADAPEQSDAPEQPGASEQDVEPEAVDEAGAAGLIGASDAPAEPEPEPEPEPEEEREPLIEAFYRTPDGLELFYRDFAPQPSAPDVSVKEIPVLCLHGLTRNGRDFEELAPMIAARGRRVIVADQRGRGQSDWDANPQHYQTGYYVGDMLGLLDYLGIGPVIVVGTSMGGLMTMMMAAAQPNRVVGAVINDIGPDLAPEGIARIAGYVAGGPPADSWPEAAMRARTINGSAFPTRRNDMTFWDAFARRLFRETPDGRILLDYDPQIAAPFQTGESLPADLWAFFEALKAVPTLVTRGELSDLLAPETLAKMSLRKPDLETLEVSAVGHAPLLTEPEAWGGVSVFLNRLA